MLGSTHGTLTTHFRARVVACGEEPHAAVHSMTAAAAEGDLDVSGRPLHATVPDLDRFFRPESVAVIGASDTEGRPRTGITRQLVAWAERVGARLHPVHPTRESVFGRPCSPSVADLPEQVDLAVLLVGDPLPVIEELGQAKVKFAVAFASGFAETGEEGAAAQARLAAAVERSGLRLLGPNTNLNAFEAFRDDLDGPAIALITQSGHQGRPVYTLQELGVRLSHWAPTGNEADLETADFISYFSQRPEVGAIACYVEGLKDGRSFLLAADRAARAGVPVVAVKVGRTETGARTAASHTGKLTGADQVVDAAMRQFGVIRVDGLDELQDTAALLARARKPQADGVVVYSISGGTGAHFSDLATGAGLKLPTLSEEKQRELHEWIPGLSECGEPGRQRRASGRRLARPEDHRRDPRRPGRRGADLPDHRPVPPDERQARAGPGGRGGDHGQAGVRGVGIAGRYGGRVPHDAARLVARRHLPHVRQLHHRREGLSGPPPVRRLVPLALRRGAAHAVALVPQGAGPDASGPPAERARGEAAPAGLRHPRARASSWSPARRRPSGRRAWSATRSS